MNICINLLISSRELDCRKASFSWNLGCVFFQGTRSVRIIKLITAHINHFNWHEQCPFAFGRMQFNKSCRGWIHVHIFLEHNIPMGTGLIQYDTEGILLRCRIKTFMLVFFYFTMPCGTTRHFLHVPVGCKPLAPAGSTATLNMELHENVIHGIRPMSDFYLQSFLHLLYEELSFFIHLFLPRVCVYFEIWLSRETSVILVEH